MAFMRFTAVPDYEDNRQPDKMISDNEILIASEVRQKIDKTANTSTIDRRLNLLIMKEIHKYRQGQPNVLHLSEDLDKVINGVLARVAPQVPGMLALHAPMDFRRF